MREFPMNTEELARSQLQIGAVIAVTC